MVKQGRFAKSGKLQQIKEIRKARQVKAERTIDEKQVNQFVLVRYGLTLKSKLIGSDKETMQRFLIEWLDNAPLNETWSVQQLAEETLKQINIRVPYQFYRALVRNWSKFQRFLKREIPAVPLATRLMVTDTLTTEAFESLVGRQLAANTLLATLGGNPQLMKQINLAQIESLAQNLMIGSKIDWEKVAAAFKPLPFDLDSAPDEETKTWLAELIKE